jgi:hypothetical protein
LWDLACLPKDGAGNFVASQEKSDVVTRPARLPGGKNAGDEQAAAGDPRLYRLAGGLPGRKGRGPHAQDPAAKLL